jgi:hypothetical protein
MNGADRNCGFRCLMIVLQGATMSDLARISIPLNHLAGVVAGLVPAMTKFQAQEKNRGGRETSPAMLRIQVRQVSAR